jgi:adenylate cyclase
METNHTTESPDRKTDVLYPVGNGRSMKMRAIRRIVIEEAAIGAAFLVFTWYVYYFVGAWGISDHLKEGGLLTYVQGVGIHIEILVLGIGSGILLTVVNHLSEVPAIRGRPVGQIVLIKTGMIALGIVFLSLITIGIFLLFLYSWEEFLVLVDTISLRLLLALTLWQILNLSLLSFLLEVRRKVGPGDFLALITGRYHKPREEVRVFLFLDLKGSTGITERLGHTRYSQFIRHCFHDLTEFVQDHRAQIYQFVGDEVVLMWPGKDPHAERRSIELFFDFQRCLLEKRAWYQEQFGATPEFRGGVDEGMVTVSEVGDLKREIAFHGDALNTASRLLELCREASSEILISGRIQEVVSRERAWTTEFKGEIPLRGKEAPVAVYGVEVV